MNILAIDTACDILCVALLFDSGDGKAARRMELSIDEGLRHAELLMEAIDSLCRQADLKATQIQGIVCAKGPGSFTGLRIGMASAKGLASALGCPIISVSTLEAIAWRHRHWPGLVVPLIDARKQRFYGGTFFQGEKCGDFFDLPSEGILAYAQAHSPSHALGSPILWTGPDAGLFVSRCPDQSQAIGLLDGVPRKSWGLEMAELGLEKLRKGLADGPEAGPEYVRASDAELGINRNFP